MQNKIYSIVIILVVLCLAETQNTSPIIGVYTEPSIITPYPDTQYQYIAASYVKSLQQAGARVVPIFYDSSQDTLDDIFSKINGILFPGGDVTLDQNNQFTQNAQYLINKAIYANQQGDYFPIWGTCLGFQLLHVLISGYAPDVLSRVDDKDTTHSLWILNQGRLYSDMSTDMIHLVSDNTIYYYNHNWGVLQETYDKYPALSNFFFITATSFTNYTYQGIEFIASVEAKDYPIYATQFHPEKMYEWKRASNHSSNAILAQQYMSNFFVREATQSMHSISESELASKIIWNYPCIQPGDTSSFNQVYILPNSFYINKLNQTKQNQNKIDFL